MFCLSQKSTACPRGMRVAGRWAPESDDSMRASEGSSTFSLAAPTAWSRAA